MLALRVILVEIETKVQDSLFSLLNVKSRDQIVGFLHVKLRPKVVQD